MPSNYLCEMCIFSQESYSSCSLGHELEGCTWRREVSREAAAGASDRRAWTRCRNCRNREGGGTMGTSW